MLGLMTTKKTAETEETIHVALTNLEELFAVASSIGGVRVWQHRSGDSYEVTISFERKSGSKVEAKAKNTVLSFAVQDAIKEAIILGDRG